MIKYDGNDCSNRFANANYVHEIGKEFYHMLIKNNIILVLCFNENDDLIYGLMRIAISKKSAATVKN